MTIRVTHRSILASGFRVTVSHSRSHDWSHDHVANRDSLFFFCGPPGLFHKMRASVVSYGERVLDVQSNPGWTVPEKQVANQNVIFFADPLDCFNHVFETTNLGAKKVLFFVV